MGLCLGVVLGLFARPSASAADVLRLLTGNVEPYAIAEGPRPGFAIEIVREMATRAGHSVDVLFLPWQRALADAAQGKNRLIVPVVRTPEREIRYAWVAELVPNEPFYFIAVDPDVDISGFEAARHAMVGAMANAPGEQILIRNGVYRLDLATENRTSAHKLARGRIDLWFGRRTEAIRAFRAMGEDPARLRFGKRVDAPPSYLAASPGFSDQIGAQLRRALDTMKLDGTYRAILERYHYGWLLETDAPPPAPKPAQNPTGETVY